MTFWRRAFKETMIVRAGCPEPTTIARKARQKGGKELAMTLLALSV